MGSSMDCKNNPCCGDRLSCFGKPKPKFADAPAPAPAPVDAAGLVAEALAEAKAYVPFNSFKDGAIVQKLTSALAAAAEREAALEEKVRQSALDYLALDMQATEALEREKALVRRNAFLEQTKGCDMNDFVQMGMARDEAEARVTAAEAEAEHWARLACDDLGKNPPTFWKERAEAAEARVTAAEAERDEHAGFCAEAIEQRAAAEAVLNLYRDAVRIDAKMEGPQFMGCNSSALRRAWEADRAAIRKETT